MDAISWQKELMKPLVKALRKDYPELSFIEGDSLCWSPESKQVRFRADDKKESVLGLLHEIGHANLGHSSYDTDIELLQKEVIAWREALRLAEKYGYSLERVASHIEDCLDSYRDWIFKRSTCPSCGLNGIEHTQHHYYCINCTHRWTVSFSRFCRPYRYQKTRIS